MEKTAAVRSLFLGCWVQGHSRGSQRQREEGAEIPTAGKPAAGLADPERLPDQTEGQCHRPCAWVILASLGLCPLKVGRHPARLLGALWPLELQRPAWDLAGVTLSTHGCTGSNSLFIITAQETCHLPRPPNAVCLAFRS